MILCTDDVVRMTLILLHVDISLFTIIVVSSCMRLVINLRERICSFLVAEFTDCFIDVRLVLL